MSFEEAKIPEAIDAALVNMVTSVLGNNDRYLTVKLKLFTSYESYDWIVDTGLMCMFVLTSLYLCLISPSGEGS